jgi:hypothetical protein
MTFTDEFVETWRRNIWSGRKEDAVTNFKAERATIFHPSNRDAWLHSMQISHYYIPCFPGLFFDISQCIFFIHIYFYFKCNLLLSHPSSSLPLSSVYGHLKVLSILLKLLHSMSNLRIACERDISQLKYINLK